MFWWIVLAVVVVLGAASWFLSGRARNGGIDSAKLARMRKIDEGRASDYGGL